MEKKDSKRREVLQTLSGQGLSREAMARVAELTGVPEADVYGAATFYTLLTDPGPRVCQGLSCKLEGADELATKLESQGGTIHRVSCLGQCDRAPVSLGEDLRLDVAGPRGGITPDDPELPMNLAGAEDTEYLALARAREMGPEAVIEALEVSGLQGRGGAGFPASIKWRAVLGETATPKYVVCNADEGEPGTFKDREIMLRRPHLMLEALAIAAFVTGAASAPKSPTVQPICTILKAFTFARPQVVFLPNCIMMDSVNFSLRSIMFATLWLLSNATAWHLRVFLFSIFSADHLPEATIPATL